MSHTLFVRRAVLPTLALLSIAACGGGDTPRASPDSVVAAQASAPAAVTAATAVTADTVRVRTDTATKVIAAVQPPAAQSSPRRVVVGGLDFTGVGYDRGSPAAPVVVIDFSDFGCPYCGEFARETYPNIERDYVKTGKVFFKYVPFVAGNFPHAREATRAAECAADQGRFWPMFERIYATQQAWRPSSDVDERMSMLAREAGANPATFELCYSGHGTDARTARATTAANRLGVRVTPSFLVDDRPIQGALPWPEFKRAIDAALMVANLKH